MLPSSPQLIPPADTVLPSTPSGKPHSSAASSDHLDQACQALSPTPVVPPRGRPPLPIHHSPQKARAALLSGAICSSSISLPGVAEATRSPGQPTCCCSNAMLSKLSAAATAPPRQDLGLLEAPSPARAEKSGWPKDRNMGRHKRVFAPPTIKQLQGKGFASTHTIHSSE